MLHPTLLNRRHLLKTAACGFVGTSPFAGLAAQQAAAERIAEGAPPSPLAPRSPHFGPRAKRDLPVHAGRAVARRHVRLQAATPGRSRQVRPRAASLHGVAVRVRPPRPERAADLRTVPERREARRRPLPCSTACTPTRRPTRRPRSRTRATPACPPVDGRGCSTASAARIPTSPASSRSTRPAASAARRTTAAGSSPPRTRARASTAARRACCRTSPARSCRRRCSARQLWICSRT